MRKAKKKKYLIVKDTETWNPTEDWIQAGRSCTYDEGLFVDVVHVQGHQVLPAAQVQTALILIHQQDAVVAGVEGETEGSRRPRVHQFCVKISRSVSTFRVLF